MPHPPPEYDIRIYHAPRCSHVAETERAVAAAVRDLSLSPGHTHVRTIPVATDREAREHGLAGSPTIRINGYDVDPGSSRPGLDCRDFVGEDHAAHPYPSPHLIKDALRHAHQPRWDFEAAEPPPEPDYHD